VLSKLCDQSAVFARAYTPNPESSPARASLFTGLDPSVHGLWTNGVALPVTEQTFAQRLAQAGYSNYLAGRYQLAGVSRWTTEHIRRGGFLRIDWAHGPLHRSRQNAYLNWLQVNAADHYSTLFPAQANPDHTLVTNQQRAALEGLPDELCFNHWVGVQISDWISSQSANAPFLAVAGFSVGDGLGAEPHPETDSEGLHKQALRQADAAIGCMLEQLSENNHAEDTVVIIASARGIRNNADNTMSDQSLRVPLVVYRHGHDHQFIDTPVSTLDIAPTVLELAGVQAGARMQGSSLLGVLSGAEGAPGWALSRLRRTSSSGEHNWQTALCTQTMKLVVSHIKGITNPALMSLYNLEADPFEQHDLAGLPEYAHELEHMIDQMIDVRCALEDRTEPRIAEF